jgi:hypothetical protein
LLEPWQWAAALALALAAGTVSGISGFGAGLMLSAYLLPIQGARVTAPVLAVAIVLTNAGRVWAFRASLSLHIALPVLASVVPGALAGASAFGALGGTWADLIVGGFLIVSVVLRRALVGRTPAAAPQVLAIGGPGLALSGGTLAGTILGGEILTKPVRGVPAALAVLVAGPVAGAVYLRHARRSARPVLDLRLLSVPSFGLSVAARTLFRIGVGTIPFLLPSMIQVGFGWSAAEAGLITFWASVGAIAMKVVAREERDFSARRAAVRAGEVRLR